MNDFKSYSAGKNNAGGNAAANGGEQLNNTVEMAKMITKAMNGKSAAQILQTIISEAERGKREGTLTNADLDSFYAAISPVLDGAKRRKLKEVIARLKDL